ncbi:hypothetical protein F2Q69_00025059 [Brassica cretica]|uniref:Uncharacterized protein n=1 Tax=Brassica cretica TaxID=69181 RepID=A0A8S9QJK9_BRACR|nr:hypothetical protein F2Q69_00025059 [Brassica cretica]
MGESVKDELQKIKAEQTEEDREASNWRSYLRTAGGVELLKNRVGAAEARIAPAPAEVELQAA